MEGCDEVRLEHREHPVVPQEEPDEQEQAEDDVHVILVCVLSPWILVGIVVADDDRLGDERPHAGGVVQEQRDLEGSGSEVVGQIGVNTRATVPAFLTYCFALSIIFTAWKCLEPVLLSCCHITTYDLEHIHYLSR